jgi:hypothetical protein
MLSEYRQRFGDLQAELNRENYLVHSGRPASRTPASLLREAGDLFDQVDALRRALEEIAPHRTTERAAIGRLIAFAAEGRMALRALEVTEEIARYEACARLQWEGGELSLAEAAGRLAVEAEAVRRRDLYARRADLIRGADDLRAERLLRWREAAQSLGFDSLTVMRRQLRGVEIETLANQAERLLAKTERGYVAALASLLPRESGVSMDDAVVADLPFLHRYTRFDHFFSGDRLLARYRDLFAGFGFQTDQQTNLELDFAERPGRDSHAFCAPIRIPGEVKLVFSVRGGQANARAFLREAGRAQHAAWTSPALHPEFRFGGGAVPLAWGMLLEMLPLDPRWLMNTCGFVENAAFRHALAVFRLLAVRQSAVVLLHECEMHAGAANPQFAARMTDALHVRFDETDRLRCLDDPFHSADFLRAAAFESQLRDHLKTRFGQRWWAMSKAGEMLIDLWNTGNRYSIEELAALIGLGEPDFDWLAAELLDAIEPIEPIST